MHEPEGLYVRWIFAGLGDLGRVTLNLVVAGGLYETTPLTSNYT